MATATEFIPNQAATEAVTAHVLWVTVGLSCEGDTVARLGGDEFVVLMENVTSPDEAQDVAQNVRRLVLGVKFGQIRSEFIAGVVHSVAGNAGGRLKYLFGIGEGTTALQWLEGRREFLELPLGARAVGLQQFVPGGQRVLG